MKTNTPSENFALNQWLSWFDDDLSYAEILALMRDPGNTWSCEEVDVWEAVETFTLDQVADFIEDTKQAFDHALNELKGAA